VVKEIDVAKLWDLSIYSNVWGQRNLEDAAATGNYRTITTLEERGGAFG